MNANGVTTVVPLPPPHCNKCRIPVWKDMTEVRADPNAWHWYCTGCKSHFTPTAEDKARYRHGSHPGPLNSLRG